MNGGPMHFSESVKTILAEIDNVAARINPDDAERFYTAVIAARRVFITGEGRSLFVSQTFAMRLSHLGITAAVIGEATCPKPGPGDLLVAVSGSGKTATVLAIVEGARKAGSRVHAISATRENPLAKIADDLLMIPGATKAEGKGEAKSAQPLSSLFDQALHVFLDAINLLIFQRKGKSKDQVKAKHNIV